MSSNRLGEAPEPLPPALAALSALTALNLNHNALTALPPVHPRPRPARRQTRQKSMGTRKEQRKVLHSFPHPRGVLIPLPPPLPPAPLPPHPPPAALCPQVVPALTALTSLALAANALSALPPALGALTRLARLSVKNNAPLSALPVELGACTGPLPIDFTNAPSPPSSL